jgi:hypothetical protein
LSGLDVDRSTIQEEAFMVGERAIQGKIREMLDNLADRTCPRNVALEELSEWIDQQSSKRKKIPEKLPTSKSRKKTPEELDICIW